MEFLYIFIAFFVVGFILKISGFHYNPRNYSRYRKLKYKDPNIKEQTDFDHSSIDDVIEAQSQIRSGE